MVELLFPPLKVWLELLLLLLLVEIVYDPILFIKSYEKLGGNRQSDYKHILLISLGEQHF